MILHSRLLAAFLVVTVLGPATRGSSQQIQATSTPPSSLTSSLGIAKPGEPLEGAILPLVSSNSGHIVPGAFPISAPRATLPKVFAPTQPREVYTRFPWKLDIVTTVFWIGETPTANNPVPNTVSAWDRRWTSNFGGFDDPDPDGRDGFLPKGFTPGQNPFYFALPYNDITRTGTKASARAVIPWFDDAFYRSGRTVLKGRWMAIRRGDKVCYAQWEDVGPFETDDWQYVFGEQPKPKTNMNHGAGLDVSPAVRDYLEFGSGYGTVDWRFVDIDEVPDGPWKQLGANNPFANSMLTDNGAGTASESILRVRELRDRLMASLDAPTAEPAKAAPEKR
jgi:hypothetical protein